MTVALGNAHGRFFQPCTVRDTGQQPTCRVSFCPQIRNWVGWKTMEVAEAKPSGELCTPEHTKRCIAGGTVSRWWLLCAGEPATCNNPNAPSSNRGRSKWHMEGQALLLLRPVSTQRNLRLRDQGQEWS
mmetsp:Transcript_93172/g.161516  ORF Transcript_93172/g.161516 Transcript_93172/m.161516 type:complete len:129 (-) Transcript_93172:1931-2317(-)